MRIVSNLVFCIITIFHLCLLIQADFENDVLDEHNKYRKKHGCPNLKLDSSLNDDCKSYAQEIAAANALTHSDGPYGENLCYTTSDPVTCVKNWYDEIKDYNYDKPGFSAATGHFTQLIWKASSTLGVGKHSGSDGKVFVVARYKPAGNVEGQYKENVPRSRSGNKQDCSKYLILCSWIFMLFMQDS